MVAVRRLLPVLVLAPAAAATAWVATGIGPEPVSRERASASEARTSEPSTARPFGEPREDTSRRRARLRQSRTAGAPRTGLVVFEGFTTDLGLQLAEQRFEYSHVELPPGRHDFRISAPGGAVTMHPIEVYTGETTTVRLGDVEGLQACLARGRAETYYHDHPPTRGHRCPTATEPCIDWLSRHQEDDGTWSAAAFKGRCRRVECEGATGTVDAAQTTALPLLCYLGYGETHQSGTYKQVVKTGLAALKKRQRPDGRFDAGDDLRSHAIATLAMTEAYGMTGSHLFKGPGRKAIEALAAAKPTWDLETIVWEACVVRSAEMAELNLPDGLRERVLNQVLALGEPAAQRPRHNAMLLAARILLRTDELKSPVFVRAAVALNEYGASLIAQDRHDEIDPATAYFATIALFRMGGSRRWEKKADDPWRRWNETLKVLVIDRHDFVHGWAVRKDPFTGRPIDRVTATALLELSLQVYYRYGRVFGTASTTK